MNKTEPFSDTVHELPLSTLREEFKEVLSNFDCGPNTEDDVWNWITKNFNPKK